MDEALQHLLAVEGVLSSAQLVARGVSRSRLSRAAQRGDVVRVLPRVFALRPLPSWPRVLVRDGVPDDDHVQHVAAVLLAVGRSACAAGATAAALRGWDLLHEPTGTVEVLVPHDRTRVRVRRARVRRRRGLAAERVLLGRVPLRVLSAVDAVADCCVTLPLVEAVVVLDSALRTGAVTQEQVLRAARTLRGRRRRQVRRVLALSDPASGSVLESVLRVRLVQAGIFGWETQRVVRDAGGRHVLRADFCFASARLVVETDGRRWHQDTARDQRVDNALAAAGWRVLRLSWTQVVHEPEAVLALVRQALAAGRQEEAG